MSSQAKKRAKMYEAKKAISTLSSYAKKIDEPIVLAELLNLLLEQVYATANAKDASPFKGVNAFAELNQALNRKAVKARFSHKVNVSKDERNIYIMGLFKRGKSYQEIADRCEEMGIKITKSAVYKVVQKIKNQGAENGL